MPLLGLPDNVFVEIDFASANPLVANSAKVWTNVTSFCRFVDVNGGRQHELGITEEGRGVFIFNNRDRRFDPSNTSGPYSPFVVPMRPIRVRAVYNAVTYFLFQGFIESWGLDWPNVSDAETVVGAVDAFKVFNLLVADNPYVAAVLADAPLSYYKLDESSGATVATDSSGNGEFGTYEGTPSFALSDPITDGIDGAVSFNAIGDRMEIPEAAVPGDFGFAIEFWIKSNQAVGAQGDWVIYYQATLDLQSFGFQVLVETGGGDAGKLLYEYEDSFGFVTRYSSIRVDDQAWHHCVLLVGSGGMESDVSWYIDGVLRNGTSTNDAMVPADPFRRLVGSVGSDPRGSTSYGLNNFLGSIYQFAIYVPNISSTRVIAHYGARTAWINDLPGARVGKILDIIGWPAADRNIETGATALQSYAGGDRALSHLQAVAKAENGLLFVDGQGRAAFFGRGHLRTSSGSITSQATFGDSPTLGELPYRLDGQTKPVMDDLDLWNEAQVSRSGGPIQRAFDASSRTSYVRRVLSETGLIAVSDLEMLDRAHFRVAEGKLPLTRIRKITIFPLDAPATLFPQALGRALWDRITVKRTPPPKTGPRYSQESIIEGYRHVIEPGIWKTSWSLSPVGSASNFWVLGSATYGVLGSTTRLGY